MKNKRIIIISAISLLLLSASLFNAFNASGSNNEKLLMGTYANANGSVPETQTVADVSSNAPKIQPAVDTFGAESNSAESVLQTVRISADFSKSYNSYEDLIPEAEYIAYGTVGDVVSFVDENRRIKSRFAFIPTDILKGNDLGNEIYVETQGGSVPYSKYFQANEEILKKKLSLEDFESERVKALENSDKLVEEIFADVNNAQIGDNYLLFLSKLPDSDAFFILGSSYYGQFIYDKSHEEFYRVSDSYEQHKMNRNTDATKELIITLSELKAKIEVSDDVSPQLKKIREEQLKKSRQGIIEKKAD